MRCERCRGRGWVKLAGKEWASPCRWCRGIGSISLYALAFYIGENRSTLYRLRDVRTNGRTSARLLRKLEGWAVS